MWVGGPHCPLGGPQSQKAEPQSQLGGPWIPLGGPQSKLEEPLRKLQRWESLRASWEGLRASLEGSRAGWEGPGASWEAWSQLGGPAERPGGTEKNGAFLVCGGTKGHRPYGAAAQKGGMNDAILLMPCFTNSPLADQFCLCICPMSSVRRPSYLFSMSVFPIFRIHLFSSRWRSPPQLSLHLNSRLFSSATTSRLWALCCRFMFDWVDDLWRPRR